MKRQKAEGNKCARGLETFLHTGKSGRARLDLAVAAVVTRDCSGGRYRCLHMASAASMPLMLLPASARED